MKVLVGNLKEAVELNKGVIENIDFQKLNLRRMSPIIRKSIVKVENDEEFKIQEVNFINKIKLKRSRIVILIHFFINLNVDI